MSTVREDYCTKVKIQLNELNAKVDALEAHMHEAHDQMRVSYRSELDELRLQSEGVSTQLAQIKTSGEASWDKMVEDTDKVRDAFKQSLDSFKSKL